MNHSGCPCNKRVRVFLAVGLMVAAYIAAETNPTCVIPARPLLDTIESPLTLLEPAYVDLEQAGHHIEGAPPVLTEGAPVAIHFEGHVASATPQPETLRVQLEGSGPVVETTAAINPTGWQFGESRGVDCELTLNKGYYAGDAVLRFALSGENKGEPSIKLCAIPVHVKCNPAHAQVDPARIAEVFGSNAICLDAQFRLGKNGSVKLGIPVGTGPVQAIGIVSSLAWVSWRDFLQKGAVIARIEAISPAGASAKPVVLRHGIDTMQTDFSVYSRRDAVNRMHVPVFSERIREDDSKKPVTLRQYHGVLPFNKPVSPTEISFTCALEAGVLQVQEVVLIPAE